MKVVFLLLTFLVATQARREGRDGEVKVLEENIRQYPNLAEKIKDVGVLFGKEGSGDVGSGDEDGSGNDVGKPSLGPWNPPPHVTDTDRFIETGGRHSKKARKLQRKRLLEKKREEREKKRQRQEKKAAFMRKLKRQGRRPQP